jgi:FKBP-type peptidyl-prolyl cis-trans isomerase FkpA
VRRRGVLAPESPAPLRPVVWLLLYNAALCEVVGKFTHARFQQQDSSMIKMLRATLVATTVIGVGVGVGVGLLGAFAAPAMQGQVDYSGMPPTPADIHKQIAAAKTNLAKAIEIAEKQANGVAKQATMKLESSPPSVEVSVVSADKEHLVVVNAESGAVTFNTVVNGSLSETPSGLRYFDIKVGSGDQPQPTSVVKVHYTGWLIDGKKFDSSLDRGQPTQFPLNGVIAGWTEGVSGMKVGGKRKLVIPYQLAYGEMGRPPIIPPKATLVFDIELLEIVQR